jgi:hypothetical protein
MGGFTSRPIIGLPLIPVLRPTWIEHLEPGTHYSASNFTEDTPNYRIQYACENNECRAEVFDKKLNKGMAFDIKNGKCFYNDKHISKTALLDLVHKESLTPLVKLLIQHAGFELPTQHHSVVHKIESGSKSHNNSLSVKGSKSLKKTNGLNSSNMSSRSKRKR